MQKSPHVSCLSMWNVQLSENATLKIIQTYTHTNAGENDEMKEFYQELEEPLAQKSKYTITMSDFNTKVTGWEDIWYFWKLWLYLSYLQKERKFWLFKLKEKKKKN